MKVTASWESALPLSSNFEMHLQKGSIFYISQRLSLWSTLRCGGALTVPVFNVAIDWISVHDVVSVGASIFAAHVGGRTILSGCNYLVNGSIGDYLSVFDIFQS